MVVIIALWGNRNLLQVCKKFRSIFAAQFRELFHLRSLGIVL